MNAVISGKYYCGVGFVFITLMFNYLVFHSTLSSIYSVTKRKALKIILFLGERQRSTFMFMWVTAWVQQSVPEAAVNRAPSSSLVNAPCSWEATTAAVPLSYCLHSSALLSSQRSHMVPGLAEMRCRRSGGKALQRVTNNKNKQDIQAEVTSGKLNVLGLRRKNSRDLLRENSSSQKRETSPNVASWSTIKSLHEGIYCLYLISCPQEMTDCHLQACVRQNLWKFEHSRGWFNYCCKSVLVVA